MREVANDMRKQGKLRLWRNPNKGQAAVEFSMVVLILVFTIIGTIDFSRAFFSWASMANAAREGARYGTVWPLRWTDADYAPPNNIEARTRAMLTTMGTGAPTVEIHCYDQWGGSAQYERYLCRTGNQIQVIIRTQFRSWTRIIPTLNLTARARMVID
jgi:hypothetical protein